MHWLYQLFCMFQYVGKLKLKPNQIIVAAEIKFTRKILGYNWTDYKTNTHIIHGLNITSVTEKINVYKSNYTKHVYRMPRERLTRIFKYIKKLL